MLGRRPLPRRRSRSLLHDKALRIALGLFVLSGAVAGTSASFNATTTNASSLATDSLIGPTTFTAAPSGNNVAFGWTGGGFQSGASTWTMKVTRSATALGSADGMTPPACTTGTATGTSVGSSTSNTGPWTSTAVATAANTGSWICTRGEPQYTAGSSVWVSQTDNKVAQVQLGNVVRTVRLIDGSADAANVLSQGDVIEIRFNQKVVTPDMSTWLSSCTRAGTGTAGFVSLGRNVASSTACGNSSTENGDTRAKAGRLNNFAVTGSATFASSHAFYDSALCDDDAPTDGYAECYNDGLTACATGAACDLLVVTFNAPNGSPTSSTLTNVTSGTAAYVPNTTVGAYLSSTGSVALCTVNGGSGLCRPMPSGAI